MSDTEAKSKPSRSTDKSTSNDASKEETPIPISNSQAKGELLDSRPTESSSKKGDDTSSIEVTVTAATPQPERAKKIHRERSKEKQNPKEDKLRNSAEKEEKSSDKGDKHSHKRDGSGHKRDHSGTSSKSGYSDNFIKTSHEQKKKHRQSLSTSIEMPVTKAKDQPLEPVGEGSNSPSSPNRVNRARSSSVALASGLNRAEGRDKDMLPGKASVSRRKSQGELHAQEIAPKSLDQSGGKKKKSLFAMMGSLLSKSQRNPSEDIEEKSGRLESAENKGNAENKGAAKGKGLKSSHEGKKPVAKKSGDKKSKESSESREVEEKRARKGNSQEPGGENAEKPAVAAGAVINSKTGQPKRHFKGLKTITDFPDDIQARLKDSGIPLEYFNQNLQDFVYCLRFVTRDSFRLESKPELDPPDSRPQCSEGLIELGQRTIQTPTKDLKKMYRHLVPSGKGGYGEVFGAKELDTKEHVAIKKVAHTTKKDIGHNLSEVAFLVSCKHPNIVSFKHAWVVDETKELWIVTEFLEGGTLGTASKAHNFSETHIAFVAHEILQALKYLHARNFVHRDLKSANVMLSIKGEVKLIDFGLCVDLGSSDGNRTQLLGSPFWIPPEMIKHIPHNHKADIWSFAVCIIELFYGKVPYGHSRLDCMFRAVTGRLPDILDKCSRLSSTARDFLLKALVVDQEKRASAQELLAHPFLKNGAKNKDGIETILRTVFVNRTLALAGI